MSGLFVDGLVTSLHSFLCLHIIFDETIISVYVFIIILRYT